MVIVNCVFVEMIVVVFVVVIIIAGAVVGVRIWITVVVNVVVIKHIAAAVIRKAVVNTMARRIRNIRSTGIYCITQVMLSHIRRNTKGSVLRHDWWIRMAKWRYRRICDLIGWLSGYFWLVGLHAIICFLFRQEGNDLARSDLWGCGL